MDSILTKEMRTAIRSAFGDAFQGSAVIAADAERVPLRPCRACLVPQMRSIDAGERTIQFVASDETRDRYGDILRCSGWDCRAYEKNPVFLWAHRSGEPPIGRTLSITKEQNPPALVANVQFTDPATNPFGTQIFNLYDRGFLSSVSVGFRPLRQPEPLVDEASGKISGYEYTSMELLELSAVPLPANPNAQMRMVEDGLISLRDAGKIFEPEESDGALLDEIRGLREDLALHGEKIEELARIVRSLVPKEPETVDEFLESLT